MNSVNDRADRARCLLSCDACPDGISSRDAFADCALTKMQSTNLTPLARDVRSDEMFSRDAISDRALAAIKPINLATLKSDVRAGEMFARTMSAGGVLAMKEVDKSDVA